MFLSKLIHLLNFYVYIMALKFFATYAVLLAVACFWGGSCLLKMFVAGSVWAFFVSVFLFVAGVFYSAVALFAVRESVPHK